MDYHAESINKLEHELRVIQSQLDTLKMSSGITPTPVYWMKPPEPARQWPWPDFT